MTESLSRQTCRKSRKLGYHWVMTEVVCRKGVVSFLKAFVLHNAIPKFKVIAISEHM